MGEAPAQAAVSQQKVNQKRERSRSKKRKEKRKGRKRSRSSEDDSEESTSSSGSSSLLPPLKRRSMKQPGSVLKMLEEQGIRVSDQGTGSWAEVEAGHLPAGHPTYFP